MNFKIKPFFKDVFLTFAAEGLVIFSFFLAYHLIAHYYGPEGVGEYSIIKRIVGLLQPIILLGVATGMPRYIAMASENEQKKIYFYAGSLIVAIFAIVSFVLINFYGRGFASFFFGSEEYNGLVFPFSIFLLGSIAHVLAYSYFRGSLMVKKFNLLAFINLAAVPVVIFLIFRDASLARLITYIGFSNLIITFSFLFFLGKGVFLSLGNVFHWHYFKALFLYSIPRCAGDILYSGLFSFGSILAVHFASIRDVGYLSTSQSLLNAVGLIIAPLGMIILPKASSLVSQKKDAEIKEKLNYLIGAVIQGSIFICVQLIIFADLIMAYWLGPEFSAAAPVMRITALSVVFFLLYVSISPILDAHRVKPINLINLSISLTVFFITAPFLIFSKIISSPIISFSIAFTASFACLGVLTYISIRRLYHQSIAKDFKYFISAVAINIVLGGVAIYAKAILISDFYRAIPFEILLCAVYLLILRGFKTDWLEKIPAMLHAKP